MTDKCQDDGYESVVRKMIVHEDDLFNHRMRWNAIYNGLLLAALSFSLTSEKPEAEFLTNLIKYLGLLTSIFGTLAVSFSANAQRRLMLWWQKHMPDDYNGPGVMGGEPLKFDKHLLTFFISPWIFIALILMAGWFIIILKI
jgi:hypothetical protein